jgi:hypothetical protein
MAWHAHRRAAISVTPILLSLDPVRIDYKCNLHAFCVGNFIRPIDFLHFVDSRWCATVQESNFFALEIVWQAPILSCFDFATFAVEAAEAPWVWCLP